MAARPSRRRLQLEREDQQGELGEAELAAVAVTRVGAVYEVARPHLQEPSQLKVAVGGQEATPTLVQVAAWLRSDISSRKATSSRWFTCSALNLASFQHTRAPLARTVVPGPPPARTPTPRTSSSTRLSTAPALSELGRLHSQTQNVAVTSPARLKNPVRSAPGRRSDTSSLVPPHLDSQELTSRQRIVLGTRYSIPTILPSEVARPAQVCCTKLHRRTRNCEEAVPALGTLLFRTESNFRRDSRLHHRTATACAQLAPERRARPRGVIPARRGRKLR